MAKKVFYKGYSTNTYLTTGSLSIRDIQLVKLDLLTHIFTRKGSRVRMVNHGTTIPDLPFENITDDLVQNIYDQLENVFRYDPRVELLDLVVTPYHDINTIMAAAVLKYLEFDVVDVLNIEFNDTTIR